MRATWDTYFLDIAKTVATRGTCTRKKVGAVLVSADRHIISTGYNGSTPGAPHCDEVGCMMENDRCIRTIHSEVNAIAQAARHGVAVVGSSAYVTASPCWPCFKVLAVAGIRRIVFGERFWRDVERIQEAAKEAGIELVDLSEPKGCQCGIPGCEGHVACTHPPGSATCDICTLDPTDEMSPQAVAAKARRTRRGVPDGYVKVAKGDGTFEWVKPGKLPGGQDGQA